MKVMGNVGYKLELLKHNIFDILSVLKRCAIFFLEIEMAALVRLFSEACISSWLHYFKG